MSRVNDEPAYRFINQLHILYSFNFSEFINDDLSSKKEHVDNTVMSNMALGNKAERLSVECQRPEYSSPCKIGQKWHCVLHNNRYGGKLYTRLISVY